MATQGNQPLLSGKPVFEGEEKPLTGEETEEEEEGKKPEKGKENGHKTPKPEMDDIEEPEPEKPAPDIWDSPEPEGRESSEDFLEENKELIKKVNNILTLIYPDSGVTIAELLESSSGYLSGYAGSGGTGTGGDGSGGGETGTGGDGSGGGGTGAGGGGSGGGEPGADGENSNNDIKYRIFIDKVADPIDKGVINGSIIINDFFKTKLIELCNVFSGSEKYYLNNDKYKFTSQNIEISGQTITISKTITFKFETTLTEKEYRRRIGKLNKTQLESDLDSLLVFSMMKNYTGKSDNAHYPKELIITFSYEGEVEEIKYISSLVAPPLNRKSFDESYYGKCQTDICKIFYKDDIVKGLRELPLEEQVTNYLNYISKKSIENYNSLMSSAEKIKDNNERMVYVYEELKKIKYEYTSYEKNEKKKKGNYNKGKNWGLVNSWESALGLQYSMCQGIASTFSVIMNRLGVKIGVVTSENNDHAWNYDEYGNWYDVTFDLGETTNGFYKIKNDKRFKEFPYIDDDAKKEHKGYDLKFIDGDMNNVTYSKNKVKEMFK